MLLTPYRVLDLTRTRGMLCAQILGTWEQMLSRLSRQGSGGSKNWSVF